MILLARSSEHDAESGPVHRFQAYPSNGVCARLGDKWTVQVLGKLSNAVDCKLRHSALRASLDGITQRMLTLTLRGLERDGLVVRHYFPEVPPRVEYELSELGASLLPHLESLSIWVGGHLPQIEANRRMYDETARDLRAT